MRAPRDGLELNAAHMACGLVIKYFVLGNGGFTRVIANFLSRASFPIWCNGEGNNAFLWAEFTIELCHVGFFHPSFREGSVHSPLGLRVASKQHDARGIEIQAMYHMHFAILLLKAKLGGITVFGPTPWHREQEGRLIYQN